MPETEIIEQPLETNEVIPTQTVETTEMPERTGPSVKEFVDSLTGKAREIYQRDGLGAAKKYVQRKEQQDTPGASSDVQTAAASGTATTEQNKPTRQDRNFRNLSAEKTRLERELIAANAKLELYERERAGSGRSAPAASEEKKPQVSSDARPEFPDIDQFQTTKDFNAAVKKWQTEDAAWMQRQFDQRLTGERVNQQHAQASQAWNTQIENARKIHADYDAVVFNDTTPISFTAIGVIQSLTDGGLRSYSLAKNLAEATRIAELTHIPGEKDFKSFTEFMKWVKSDPDRAVLYGEKVAIAKAELAKLSVGKPAPAPAKETPVKPLKEVIAKAPAPSAEVEVEANAAPVLDPRAVALKNHDQKAYRRIMDERDLRKHRGR